MLFNSLLFLVFFPIVILLYYIIPHKYRWIFLLIASYYFYMCWKAEYIILIIVSTVIDYLCSIRMANIENKKKRKKYLIISLISNLGILFLFKYFNFFNDSLSVVFQQFNIFYDKPEFQMLLPVGISFYTFQTLSYTFEVYQGKQKPEKHLGIFALYVSFFPQLVAGPIERFSRLGPQFRLKQVFTYVKFVNGARLMLYGFFIKMAIADNISVYVEQIYNAPQQYNSWSVLTGLLFYSFQIYSDFYGYSLIAIGSAGILGIKIMDNFKTPYLAKNISEFWQRWHISLSTWFKDYLYIPLGGNRVGVSRWYLNIFIVFTVSGLWHGANWTFVIWGAMHGIMYMFETLLEKVFKIKYSEKFDLINTIRVIKNFVLVSFIWIFFRSENLDKATTVIKSIFGNFSIKNHLAVDSKIIILFGLFLLSDILFFNNRYDTWCSSKPAYMRWLSYSFLIFAITTMSGVVNNPFIYFQF